MSTEPPDEQAPPPPEQPPPQPTEQPGYYYPPPGQPPGYYQPPPGYVYVPQQKTNGFAITALVLGIVGFFWVTPILAIVFGAIALSQIKNAGGTQSGRGMAIAGVVLGIVWIPLLTTYVILRIVYD